jgi:Tfp pilus assembly protein PilX
MLKWAWLKKVLRSSNERGSTLVTSLLVPLPLTLLSMTAILSTATDLKIAANDRTSKKVFYVAEAGLEDARSRLHTGASSNPIYDSQFGNPGWKAFIGTDAKSLEKGFQSSDGSHVRYDQLNSSLNYVVTVSHKLDGSGNILRWGDSNNDGIPEENTAVGANIFVITSEGYDSSGASKPLRIEATQVPPINAPAALYAKEHTTLQGTSTKVLGIDHCGTQDVPGVLTTANVGQNGTPQVTGSPAAIVEHSPENIDVTAQINRFKKSITHSYNVNSATLNGMDWGSPVAGASQQDASSCSNRNIVYFNTNNTYVKLAGESHGCGILMVEGDLAVHGGFNWYGVIMVTGSITFTGGEGKNVTGSILAGGKVSADLIGEDASIVYCSSAVNNQTDHLPLITLRWVELFS